MTTTTLLLGLLVFVAATCIDYAHARHVQSVMAQQASRAALWSVFQWGAATVGFVIAARITLWVLPFEAAGLYLGTILAVRPRLPSARVVGCSRSRSSLVSTSRSPARRLTAGEIVARRNAATLPPR